MRQCCERLWKDLRDYRAAIVVFILYNVLARSLFHAFCPQLILTGFPCAGCGMTRAVFCFLTGQFSRAMKLNPAAPLWILFLSWFFYNRYARGVYHKVHHSGWGWYARLRWQSTSAACFTVSRESRRWFITEII